MTPMTGVVALFHFGEPATPRVLRPLPRSMKRKMWSKVSDINRTRVGCLPNTRRESTDYETTKITLIQPGRCNTEMVRLCKRSGPHVGCWRRSSSTAGLDHRRHLVRDAPWSVRLIGEQVEASSLITRHPPIERLPTHSELLATSVTVSPSRMIATTASLTLLHFAGLHKHPGTSSRIQGGGQCGAECQTSAVISRHGSAEKWCA